MQTSNNITLEIEKGHLANILSQVDKHLSKLKIPPYHTARLYDNFIRQNHIVREIPKQLVKILPTDHVNPSTTINSNTPSFQNLDEDPATTVNPSTNIQLGEKQPSGIIFYPKAHPITHNHHSNPQPKQHPSYPNGSGITFKRTVFCTNPHNRLQGLATSTTLEL